MWLAILGLEVANRTPCGPAYPFSLPRGLALSISLVAAGLTVALALRQSWTRRETRRLAAT
jgi:hypothetical protein